MRNTIEKQYGKIIMNKQLLDDFAELKRTEKEITAKVDEMKILVLKELQDNGAEEVDLGTSTISIGVRRTYHYPPQIVKMDEELKLAKKSAEAKGEAEPIENPYAIFKEKKIVD